MSGRRAESRSSQRTTGLDFPTNLTPCRLHSICITEAAAARGLELPRQIDRFTILRELGHGTFGIVYLAHDPSLDRRVALKVPRREQIGAADKLTSALQEARRAVRVATSGIVQILDVRLDSEPPFIVMEYMEGGSLKDLLHRGQLAFERSVEVLIEIARALGYAHSQRIFHLDLKPANILFDGEQRPFIADFGLAMRQNERGRYLGLTVGTPAYMSPEQVRGESNHFDGSSDIWSLGVILYRMLSGRMPFEGSTRAELSAAITHASPQPLRQLDPSIPAELERICVKCLSRRQRDRFTTTADLVDDLTCWLERGHAREQLLESTVERISRSRVTRSNSTSRAAEFHRRRCRFLLAATTGAARSKWTPKQPWAVERAYRKS